MPLNIGARLGPYEIQAPIGAGGMGEVYRARDARLGRDVAIKVLPAAFSSDPERLSRFEQESRAAATLNHPNILAVYDVGTYEGSPYIVSELLEGETLRERLSEGPLPVKKAVDYAIQICHGLAAAHEKGITHRDLKPENIFLTTDGRVKILDFGLAKLTQAEPALANLSALPTTPLNTVQGVVLGTVGYMAPEQVRGLQADHRSDIFAFGVVLYEMLSGRRAFHRDTGAETMTAILKEDPSDLSATAHHIPLGLTRIVARCLDKQPSARFQSTRDLAFALEAVSTHSDTGVAVVAARRGVVGNTRLAWATATLALMAVLALSIPSVVHLREMPAPAAPEMRVEINTPSTSDAVSFALSPDGRYIVFAAVGDGPSQLWLRPLDTTEAQPMAGTEGASYPFWAPDSQSVGFFADGKLKRTEIAGGSPRTLADAPPPGGRGGTWSADGTIVFARAGPTPQPLWRIPASGGEPVAVIQPLDQQTRHMFPQFLPDGQHVLFYATGEPDTTGLYLGSLDGSDATRLGAADAAGVYVPNGWVLFIRGSTLLGQQLDLARRTLKGELVTVADPVVFDANSFARAVSVSAAGLVAYRSGEGSARQLVWFDRSRKKLGTMGALDTSALLEPRLSPDGRRAAVYRTVEGNTDVWLTDATRLTRLTFDARMDQQPIWSPDGRHLVFSSFRAGPRDLYLVASDRPGSEESLLQSASNKFPVDWSRDGRFVLYINRDPQTFYDIWVLPMEGDRTPWVWLKTMFDERRAQFSPDSRWIAFMSNESGQYQIYARPFGAGPPGGLTGSQWPVSTAGGSSPRWAANGKELYYISPDGRLMAVPITATSTTFDPGLPVPLFQTRIVGGGTPLELGASYDVSNDGRFLINTVLDEASGPITLLQNWQPGRDARESR